MNKDVCRNCLSVSACHWSLSKCQVTCQRDATAVSSVRPLCVNSSLSLSVYVSVSLCLPLV